MPSQRPEPLYDTENEETEMLGEVTKKWTESASHRAVDGKEGHWAGWEVWPEEGELSISIMGTAARIFAPHPHPHWAVNT